MQGTTMAEIAEVFDPLWSDVGDEASFPAQRPLLAHYTSIAAMERIMASDEMWFSNPLLMNDMEELRFGLNEGAFAFRTHAGIESACGTSARHQLLVKAFEHYFREFEDKHAFDTYVLCFSEHDPGDSDGALSMWRGYGGNGEGAAIVIDTAKITPNEDAPLIISNVVYASREQRLNWIDNKLTQLGGLLAGGRIPDDKLYLAAHALLERLKVFALFSKHRGFHEEREWRVVYLSDRDRDRRLTPMLHYAVGARGLEPKLKLKIGPIPGIVDDGLSLEMLVSMVILGPSVSSPIAVRSAGRMLEKVGKSKLIPRIKASTTPFRPF